MNRNTALLAAAFLLACHHGSPALADPEPAPAARRAGAATTTAETSTAPAHVGTDPGHAGRGTPLVPAAGHQLAAFAEGCFWGSEDTFRHVQGVVATAVGYSGGHTDDPDYEAVCTHTTGHAETVLIEYDPARVSYEQLLRVFWNSHDPTTLDRQGPDVGDQYRSAIFTLSPEQDAQARASMAAENTRRGGRVTTVISPLGRFWKAEGYHQQYDERTGRHSCPSPQGYGETI